MDSMKNKRKTDNDINDTKKENKEEKNVEHMEPRCSKDKGVDKKKIKSPLDKGKPITAIITTKNNQRRKADKQNQMSRYSRNESLYFSSYRQNKYEKNTAKKLSKIQSKEKQYNAEYTDVDETVDIHFARRCKEYMYGFRCHRGDCCDKMHKFPREDKILCKYFKTGECSRGATECWFWHPGKTVKYVTPNDAPLLVEPMGYTLKYLRNKLAKNPNEN